MKIIVAPDSFKNSLRAGDAAAALARGWLESRPQDEVVLLPMSDGGEGLCEALTGAGQGRYLEFETHDALMRPVCGRIGIAGNTAILEGAVANGIELLKRTELDPLRATTYGVGELLRQIVTGCHCSRIVIGIGGSATVDGGAGMLQALGVRFFRKDGTLLPPGIGGGDLMEIGKFCVDGALGLLKDVELCVACDVTNVLCGRMGAAAVFGPQKGASPEMVEVLDCNLAHFARLWGESGNEPGDGAAGGLGFALRRLGAKIVPGAELVMEQTGFREKLKGADLVITGEGCSDNQTACGKLCSSLAAAAAGSGVPVVLVSGALCGDCRELEKLFAGCFSIATGPGSLDEALGLTGENLQRTARALAAFAGALARRK